LQNKIVTSTLFKFVDKSSVETVDHLKNVPKVFGKNFLIMIFKPLLQKQGLYMITMSVSFSVRQFICLICLVKNSPLREICAGCRFLLMPSINMPGAGLVQR